MRLHMQSWRTKAHRDPRGVLRWWPRARAGAGQEEFGVDGPPRAQLLGAEELGEHGAALARSHVLRPRPGRVGLLPRLTESERVILDACAELTRPTARPRTPPAGEWLLDNLHQIEEQIGSARSDLRGLGRLPQLATGAGSGLPRIYDLAREAV